jgi:DNA processing protein
LLEQLSPWLRLSLVNGLGPRGQIQLLRALGEPVAIFAAKVDVLAQYVPLTVAQEIVAAKAENPPQLAAAIEWMQAPNHVILTLADERYPKKLLDLPDPPCVLYAKGDLALLDKPALGVVGSRNATPQGLQNSLAFSSYLSAQGMTIISGLALGVDAAAHRGGLTAAGSSRNGA